MSTLIDFKAHARDLLDEDTLQRWLDVIEPSVGRWIDNREAAQLATELLTPVSHRTIESWTDLRARSIVVNRRRLQRPEDVAMAVLHRFAAGQHKREVFNAAAA
jgi:hypothetical protein